MKEIIVQTYYIVLPIVLGYIVWLLKSQRAERKKSEERNRADMEANKRGTMLLLRVQLIQIHDTYMPLRFIPLLVYQNFLEIYRAYHDLGGNGMAEKLLDDVNTLHIQTKEDGKHA